ncbi:hypothetical protein E2C01_095244 [Portunus trituberculatus]|uniref:Uncharacterized protein n=1 Tax=Portunus trituberculatus TaxID=210409 RepID=A0A5B7JYW8_PORTR|nr:hypothetical protein [Portunus trituberculatus]
MDQVGKVNTPAPPTQANSSGSGNSSKKGSSGGGKENSAPKMLQDTHTSAPSTGEAWPCLATATKEGKKSKSSRADRSNGSARHTPTDEHNNNNNSNNNNNNNNIVSKR